MSSVHWRTRPARMPAARASRPTPARTVAEPSPQLLGADLEQRVLSLWGSILGVDCDTLDRDGIVVVADHRDFAAHRRAMVRTARGTLLLVAPAEAVTA